MDRVGELMSDSAKRILSISTRMNVEDEEDLSIEEVKNLSTSLMKEYDKLSQLSVDYVQNGKDELVDVIRESVLNLGQLCLELIKISGGNRITESYHNLLINTPDTRSLVQNISTQVKNIRKVMGRDPKQRAYNNAIMEIEEILNSFRDGQNFETVSFSEDALRIYLQSIMKKVWVSYEIFKMVIANIVSTDSEAVTVSLKNLEYCLRRTAEEVKMFGCHAEPQDYKEILECMEESFLNIMNFLRTCEEFQEENLTTFNRNYLKSSCSKSVHSLKIFYYKLLKQLEFESKLSIKC